MGRADLVVAAGFREGDELGDGVGAPIENSKLRSRSYRPPCFNESNVAKTDDELWAEGEVAGGGGGGLP
jgi:hypothetical protein